MKTFSPLFLLGAAGALSAMAGAAVAQVDTSQWKCETCPFEKTGVSGTLEAGVTWVSDPSNKFGEFNGLRRSGASLNGSASASYRAEGGLYGNLSADSDLGAIRVDGGREGQYTLRLGYAEIPHWLGDGARTPYLGVGGAVLTLPAGYPANATTAMPLAGTLQPVDIGATRKRLEAGLSVPSGDRWTHRVSVQRESRDGTQRVSGSFFATAAQLTAPVDQVTDQLEISTAYNSRIWQASLAYHASIFSNAAESLSWSNAFSTLSPLANDARNRGQLALAPDNQFHQLRATGGYQVLPTVRASADVAVGRMTQNAAYLAATANVYDAVTNPGGLQVPALPAASADASADTFNGSFRVAYTPTDRLRVNASYARDVRENKTASQGYPALAADLFLGANLRYNQPYTFKQDRYRLEADYHGPQGLKLAAGLQEDDRQRSLQDTVTTRDTSVWARAGLQVADSLGLSLKLSHAERTNSGYGRANWVSPVGNLLMRRFNLADRKRDSAGVRIDYTASEQISLGLNADFTSDRYPASTIGLTDARSMSFGADVAVAVSDDTQLRGYAQGERARSRQAGSQAAARADWFGRSQDSVDVVGLGLKQSALKGKLDLSADWVYSRSRSDVTVAAGVNDPGFPTATTAMDSLKLAATYKLQDNLWLLGSFWYELYESRDWHTTGILPGTVSNLLTLGDQAPRYQVNVLRLGLRYRF